MHTAEFPLPAVASRVPPLAVVASALGLVAQLARKGAAATLPLMLTGLALGIGGLLFSPRRETPGSGHRLCVLALLLGGLTPVVSVLLLLYR